MSELTQNAGIRKQDEKEQFRPPRQTLIVKEGNDTWFKIFETKMIKQNILMFKIINHLNYSNGTFSTENCQFSVLTGIYCSRKVEIDFNTVKPIPSDIMTDTAGEILIPNGNDEVGWCFLQMNEQGYVKELCPENKNDIEKYKHLLLKISDFQDIEIDPGRKKEIIDRLNELKQQDSCDDYYSYSISYMRMGLLPFFGVEINEENLKNSQLQKKNIFDEIKEYDVNFNDDDEILFIVKIKWQEFVYEAHWLECIVKGSIEHGVKVLMYRDLQSSRPDEKDKTNVATNNLWDIFHNNKKQRIIDEGIYCISFYALTSECGMANKKMVPPKDNTYISFGNYNMFLFKDFFSSIQETYGCHSFYHLCKNKEHNGMNILRKDCLAFAKQTPMILAITTQTHKELNVVNLLRKIDNAIIQFSPRKGYYGGWHNNDQKLAIYRLSMDIKIFELHFFSHDGLIEVLFCDFKHTLKRNVKLHIIAFASKQMYYVDHFGQHIVIAPFEDRRKGCPEIIYPEQSALMSIASGYFLPPLNNLDKTDNNLEYRYHIANFTMLPKTRNGKLENKCAYLETPFQTRRDCIFVDQLIESIYDCAEHNAITSDKYPKCGPVIKWIVEQSTVSECEKRLKELETEVDNTIATEEKKDNMTQQVENNNINNDHEDEDEDDYDDENEHCISKSNKRKRRVQKLDKTQMAKDETELNFTHIKKKQYDRRIAALEKYIEEHSQMIVKQIMKPKVYQRLLNYYDYRKTFDSNTTTETYIPILNKYLSYFIKEMQTDFRNKYINNDNYPKFDIEIKRVDTFIERIVDKQRAKDSFSTHKFWTLQNIIQHIVVGIVDRKYMDHGDLLIPKWQSKERAQLLIKMNMQGMDVKQQQKVYKIIRASHNWCCVGIKHSMVTFVLHGRSYWIYKAKNHIYCLNPQTSLYKTIHGWMPHYYENDVRIRNNKTIFNIITKLRERPKFNNNTNNNNTNNNNNNNNNTNNN
eukprot:39069_1